MWLSVVAVAEGVLDGDYMLVDLLNLRLERQSQDMDQAR